MDLETALKTIEGYILEKKGTQITINREQFNFDPMALPKLQYALGFAQEYFNSLNNSKDNEQHTNN